MAVAGVRFIGSPGSGAGAKGFRCSHPGECFAVERAFSGRSKRLADAVVGLSADPDSHVQFQAALTLGELKDSRTLPTLAQLAHQRSADPWYRLAILSSAANSASPFFHSLSRKGQSWTDPQMLVELSALIGARQNKNEIALWFKALPKLSDPDKYLTGLTRGLRLTNARNLQVPGAEQALTKLLVVRERTRPARRMGSVPLL